MHHLIILSTLLISCLVHVSHNQRVTVLLQNDPDATWTYLTTDGSPESTTKSITTSKKPPLTTAATLVTKRATSPAVPSTSGGVETISTTTSDSDDIEEDDSTPSPSPGTSDTTTQGPSDFCLSQIQQTKCWSYATPKTANNSDSVCCAQLYLRKCVSLFVTFSPNCTNYNVTVLQCTSSSASYFSCVFSVQHPTLYMILAIFVIIIIAVILAILIWLICRCCCCRGRDWSNEPDYGLDARYTFKSRANMPKWFRAMTPMSDFTAQFRKDKKPRLSVPHSRRTGEEDEAREPRKETAAEPEAGPSREAPAAT